MSISRQTRHLFSFPPLQGAGPNPAASPASILPACGHAGWGQRLGPLLCQPPPEQVVMWPARLIHSFSSHHHGCRCTSCWAMTIGDRGRLLCLGNMNSRVGTGMCARMTAQADPEWVQRAMGERGEPGRLPGAQSIELGPEGKTKGESVILDRDQHEQEQGSQGAGHTVSESRLLQELWSPWPLCPAVGTQPQRANSWQVPGMTEHR